jgi:hypothetical protein
MQRNDVLWKGLIEDIFPFFIPFFLPQYVHLFDLIRPVEFLDKELQQLYPPEEGLQHPRFVDKLVKVFTMEGTEHWVLIHVEVQGQRDEEFAQRMFRYFYRILDRYKVAVTAIAILTDDSPTFLPSRYEYRFAGTEYVYQFNRYKVLQQDEQSLAQSDNPFAIAILTVLLALKSKKLPDNDLLQLKVALYRQLRTKHFSEPVARHLFAFLQLYVNFEKPGMNSKFEKEIDSITGKTQPMGIIEVAKEMFINEGREIEAEKQKRIFVTNLLNAGKFSDEEIASLANTSLAFVQQVRAELSR